MRIIAGRHRSRAILGPADAATTRPITDRVKENLFNRLVSLGVMPSADQDDGGVALDLFCGTGSLGLEALSRGVGRCLFMDMDHDAIQRLRRNLEDLGLGDRAQVARESVLTPLWQGYVDAGRVAVAFVDPPYAMAQDPESRRRLGRLITGLLPKLEPGGVVVYRAPRGCDLPEVTADYDGPLSTDYGSMALHLYQRPLGGEAAKDAES